MRWPWRRVRLDRETRDEFDAHLELLAERYIKAGMTPEAARLAARRQFGNVRRHQEEVHSMNGVQWIDRLLQDLRYAVRQLRRHPGFSAVLVATLALGIGGSTAVFSLLNAVALRTLPVPRPEQLFIVEAFVKGPGGERTALNWDGDLKNFQTNAAQYADFFTTSSTSAFVTMGDRTERVSIGLVTGNYYEVLGVRPFLGRLIDRNDDADRDPRLVAVLGHDFWLRRFGGDPGITSRQIVLNGVSFAIVGVTPRGMPGTALRSPSDLMIPVGTEGRLEHGVSYRSIEGRLRPGVSRDQASAVLTSLFQAAPRHRDDVIVLRDNSRGEYSDRERFEQPLYALMGGALLVLLIAAANVGSLLLARGAARQREISIRLAIGAGQGRIAAQLLTECVVIALLGGAVGIALAYISAGALLSMLGTGTDAAPIDVRPDLRVLGFNTGIAVLTGLVFGLLPVFQGRRVTLNPALKESTGIVGRRPQSIARKALVVLQMSLSLVLISTAALFGRSLANLRTFDTGYDRRGVLLAGFDPDYRYSKARRYQINEDLLARVNAIPGVESAGLASTPVLSAGEYSAPLEIPGQAAPCRASMTIVSEGYLEAMRIQMVAGRPFAPLDNQVGTPHTVVVNQETVRRCFGSTNPLGQHVTAGFGVTAEIVGVVTDAKYRNLREDTLPMYYIPSKSVHPYGLVLHVRAADPRALAEPIRLALRDVDRSAPLTLVRTLEEQSDRSVMQDRLLTTLSIAFGIGALALAAIGLYGVLAFIVVRRTNEIGLRIALGAQRRQIVHLILAESSRVMLLGAVLGIAGGYVGQRLIQGLLFGISPSDLWSLLGAALILSAVGVSATILPAGRASRINPIKALRHE